MYWRGGCGREGGLEVGAGTLEGLAAASWEGEAGVVAGTGTQGGQGAVSVEEEEAEAGTGSGTSDELEDVPVAGGGLAVLLSLIPVCPRLTWHAGLQSGPEASGGPCGE